VSQFKRLQEAFEEATEYARFKASRMQWLSQWVEQYAEQEQVIEQIKTLGGSVEVKSSDPLTRSIGPDFAVVLDKVVGIHLSGSQIDDRVILQLADQRRMLAGLRSDVLISSAGVSVGDRDFVRDVLEQLGCRLRFWGVKMKPGFPLAFGRFDAAGGPLMFGLPGNPVSAMMTFEQFVRPALRKMTGHRRLFRPTVRARLAERLDKKPGRLHFVRVALDSDGDGYIARSTGNQSSGVLRSMTRARGLLVFPADATELREGDHATVQVLDADFFHSTGPAF